MSIHPDIPTDVEAMFENYLHRAGLNKKTMPAIQYSEMRKTHYAAVSSMIVMIGKVGPTDEFNEVMDKIQEDVGKFWTNYKEQYDKENQE